MLRTSKPEYAFFSLCTLLLFLFFFYLQTPGAEDKTPPNSPEEALEAKEAVPNPDTAALKEDFPAIGDKTLQTEEYVVKEGDWIAKILKEKGVLSDHSLPELLEVLRRLNTSLQDMDMIQPGEKIVILVKVLPSEEGEKATMTEKQPAAAPLKQLKSEPYKVKRGDILSRIAMSRYDVSVKQFNREYLGLFKRCNPSVKNPDHIMYGQIIRLPLYPPRFEDAPDGNHALRDLEKSARRVAFPLPETVALQVNEPPPEPVKQAQARPKPPKPDTPPPSTKAKQKASPAWKDQRIIILVAGDLGSIISQMGAEWTQSGEHFIPLKSSGHINLRAASYPIIRLNGGVTVIVDLHSTLSNKMADVIKASWKKYRVVRLSPKDDLRSALTKVLKAFKYPQILKKDQPVKLGGDIPVSITGDWIVTPPKTATGKKTEFIVINLLQGRSQGTPAPIKDYLKPLGVEIIEFPPVKEKKEDVSRVTALEKTEDVEALIRAVLNLTGQDFSTSLRIPAYESANNDFKFTIQADFYLKIRGKRHIIDLAGLDPEVVALLRDNGISVLSLSKENKPLTMVAKTLKFLDVKFKPGPHSFLTNPDDITRNVKLTLKGISFYTHNGDSVLVTPLNLPSEIGTFLSQRGYRVVGIGY